MIDMIEHTFDTGTISINYAEGPASGHPLVFLHGGSARWQSFNSIIPDFTARWHLFALDLRGHGKSSRAPGRYRLQDHANDVITFLHHRLDEPAVIVGHSLGGMIALLVAAQSPVSVRAVVVGDSPLSFETWRTVIDDQRDKLKLWRNMAGGLRSLDEIARVIADAPAINIFQSDPETLTALLDDFDNIASGYEMESVMPSIECPVLLLQADPAVGGSMTDVEVKRAQSLLLQASHEQLSGVSHVLHNERKEPVAEAITTFLSSL